MGVSSASDWINFEIVWLVEFVFWDLLMGLYLSILEQLFWRELEILHLLICLDHSSFPGSARFLKRHA